MSIRTVSQRKDIECSQGWDEINTFDFHSYIGVSFSQGPSTEKVILAPDVERKIKGGRLAVWHFSNTARSYWVPCLYAETSASVAKKLPANTGTCEIEYDGRLFAPVVTTWLCRAKPGP